ncbi:energy transducer TonB [Hymenobacter rubripertinctus]|nr:energy transducer TonB [Hymenobacter rubripertinctus]
MAQTSPIESVLFQGGTDQSAVSPEEAVYRVHRTEVPARTRLDSLFYVASKRLAMVIITTWQPTGDTLTLVEGWRANGKRSYSRPQLGHKTHGEYLGYDAQGRLREKSAYAEGKRVATECYGETGSPSPCGDYQYTEKMPVFPGGQQALLSYIGRSIRYPGKALKERRQGRVFVTFAVDETGRVRDTRVAEGISPELDAEALRVLRGLPRFEPGQQNGEVVPVYFTVPVTFSIK